MSAFSPTVAGEHYRRTERPSLVEEMMKRSLRYLLATAPLLVSTLAQARDLPNINVYHAARPAPLPAAISPRLAPPPPAAASSFDALRGVPTFLWAARAPVTGAS